MSCWEEGLRPPGARAVEEWMGTQCALSKGWHMAAALSMVLITPWKDSGPRTSRAASESGEDAGKGVPRKGESSEED